MLIAFILFLIAATIGWRRAARRGGSVADRVQYALAHGIPAFLVGIFAVTLALRMGWIG